MFDLEKFKEDYERLPVPVFLMRKYGLDYYNFNKFRNMIENNMEE